MLALLLRGRIGRTFCELRAQTRPAGSDLCFESLVALELAASSCAGRAGKWRESTWQVVRMPIEFRARRDFESSLRMAAAASPLHARGV
jgi:hypothetical protein